MVWCRERPGKGCERWKTDEREKKRKRRLPCFIHFFNFTLYTFWQNGKHSWPSENVTVFFLVYIFRTNAHCREKLHLCKGTELVFFFLCALEKALVNDKTNKAREVNKRGRTRYPLRWAVQNGQSFGFLKQLKRLKNRQKLEKEMVCSQQDRVS